MKQRMLKSIPGTMFLLLVLGAFNGCMHKTGSDGAKPSAPQIGTFYLMIHGPFIVVLSENGVTALTPRDPDHEFIPGYPERHERRSMPAECKTTTEFELQGAESAETTTLDIAFRPVTFHFDEWKLSKNEDLFVGMKLPRPIRIDGLGPLQAVKFAAAPDKIEYVPLTMILEFRTEDIGKVQMMVTERGGCKTEKPSQTLRPLSCDEMESHYEEYWKNPDNPKEPHAERPFVTDLFRRCVNSGFLFVGVGLHPNYFLRDPHPEDQFERSGIDFFNNKLLPLIFGREKEAPAGRKLILIKPGMDRSEETPRLHEAVYKPSAARLTPVMYASTENCQSPGAIVTVH